MYLRGMAGTALYSWDGVTKTLLSSVDQVTAAMSAGKMIQDDTGYIYDNQQHPGSMISIAGGILLNGCPINVLFGQALTLDQAKVLVGISPTLQKYGFTTCLTQAQAMVGGPTAPPPTQGAPTTTGSTTGPVIQSVPAPPYPVYSPGPPPIDVTAPAAPLQTDLSGLAPIGIGLAILLLLAGRGTK